MQRLLYGLLLIGLSLPALAQESQEIPGQVLYKLKDALTLEQLKKFYEVMDMLGQPVNQKSLLEKPFVELINFGINKSNLLSNELVIRLLEETDAVEFAESNTIEHEIGYDYSDPDFDDQWHHRNMESAKAWDITMGSSNVVVAVCDSGVEANHEDLKGRVLTPGYNFVTKKAESSPSTNHGTMVAGLIASSNNNKGGVGVAPNVKILPLKITTNGSTSLSTITNCIRYGADQGAKVINVSFTGIQNSSVSAAGKYAREKGALLVYAAGNQGNHTSYSDWINVVAVGSTTSADKRSSFSNYGNFIDVMAPGSAVYTTLPYITKGGAKYKAVNGTSFAAPIAAGVAALIYSINPNFSPEQVERYLSLGAEDMGNSKYYGYGRVNAFNSVVLASEALTQNKAPVARFSLNALQLIAPTSITLDGTSSSDPDGSISSYRWLVNNKLHSTQSKAQLSLTQAGTYEIKLEVEDNKGAKNSLVQKITVLDAKSGQLKVSSIKTSVLLSSTKATGKAQVTVTDGLGKAVSGAKVSASWDGSNFIATTNSSGVASFTSPTQTRGHDFSFKILDINLSNYSYAQNLNEKDSAKIVTSPVWYRRIFGL